MKVTEAKQKLEVEAKQTLEVEIEVTSEAVEEFLQDVANDNELLSCQAIIENRLYRDGSGIITLEIQTGHTIMDEMAAEKIEEWLNRVGLQEAGEVLAAHFGSIQRVKARPGQATLSL
jgi:streptomycin 6-kinase